VALRILASFNLRSRCNSENERLEQSGEQPAPLEYGSQTVFRYNPAVVYPRDCTSLEMRNPDRLRKHLRTG